MNLLENPTQYILGCLLVLSSIGVIIAPKPVHASLSFLLTLMTLAAIYLQLSAQFIAVMQVLVYAGAILVIFMFVIILFQDAHQQIVHIKPQSRSVFLYASGAIFLAALIFLGTNLLDLMPLNNHLPQDYGTVQSLGKILYIDFFFPFEAVILLFLVSIVGALYIGKKRQQ